MNRRTFLAAGAGVAASSLLGAASGGIIDTHTHFYDPSRPQGVPWPSKNDTLLYRTVLPVDFRKLTEPLGVTGTVVVEASPWVEDNQWLLDLAANEPVIKGIVGNLEPGKPEFRKNLERFARNKLFLGIRSGGLWGRSIDILENPAWVADIKALAAANLQLDGIGGPALLPRLVRLSDEVPNLRVVIDHMPFDPPREEKARAEYQQALKELGKRPRIYSKVSNVLRQREGRVVEDLEFYRSALDELWEVFGPDRLIYGSNWPVSDRSNGPYPALLKVVRQYFAGKGPEASHKYFVANSRVAYRWVER